MLVALLAMAGDIKPLVLFPTLPHVNFVGIVKYHIYTARKELGTESTVFYFTHFRP